MSAKSTLRLRQLLSLASRQFVQKQFPATLQAVSEALHACSNVSEEPKWYEERWDSPLEPFRDLKRRLVILLITFYATKWSSPEAYEQSQTSSKNSLHAVLESLEAISSTVSSDGRLDKLIEAASAMHSDSSSSSKNMSTSRICCLPPSVVVALLLAGLKLGVSRQHLLDLTGSWMAGIPQDMLVGLAQEAKMVEAQHQDQAGLLASVPSLDSAYDTNFAARTSRPYLAELLRGYHKVVETYALMVLTQAHRFQEARYWLEDQQEGRDRGVLPMTTILVGLQLFCSSAVPHVKHQALKDKLAQLQTRLATATDREKAVAQQPIRRQPPAISRDEMRKGRGKRNEGRKDERGSSASSSSASASSSPTLEGRQREEEVENRKTITVHNQETDEVHGFWARLHQSILHVPNSVSTEVESQPLAKKLALLASTTTPLLRYVFGLWLAWYLFRRAGRNRIRDWSRRIVQTVRLGVKTTSL